MSTVMHGAFSRAHLCTVQSVARQCPYPAYRRWSSAGTGRHRSPHQNHTPAPPWPTMTEIDITRISLLQTKTMTFFSVLKLGCKLFHPPWSCFSRRNQGKGTRNELGRSPRCTKLQNYRLTPHRMLGIQDLWRKWYIPINIIILLYGIPTVIHG